MTSQDPPTGPAPVDARSVDPMAVDPRAVDRHLLEGAALEGAERELWLRGLEAAAPGVAREVRRRLAAAEEMPDDFLEAPLTTLEEALFAEGDEVEAPEGDERYAIGELLGEGGMARVYRAFDRQLNRPVALKLLHGIGHGLGPGSHHHLQHRLERRLLREARAQARVRHDHVLEIYETGELAGRPYIASRFVSGGTLAERLRSLPLEQTVRLIAQVAEGLHAAHREGLLHGDVKPSNILLEETPDGELRAWIGDFGIAADLGSGERSSGAPGVGEPDPERQAPVAGPTTLAGTPQFMAPELRREGLAAADRRADVYSLGVTLHQALTGELPRRGETGRAGLAQGAHDRTSHLPPDLRAVIARCLAEEPAGRYPSARAVAEDLRRFLEGEVVEAYADRRAYRLTRFAARHRTLLAVAGVAAVLLIGALAVAALLGVQAVRANARADERRGQAEDLIQFMLLDLRGKLEAVGRLDLLDDVGDRALGYFAAVPEEELSDQELARRSTALFQIGEVRIRQGDLAGAEAPLEESLALALALVDRHPESAERLFDLAQSEFWLGYARWEQGDLEAAQGHLEAYHRAAERLVELAPEDPQMVLELSYAESNLGSLAQARGDLEAARGRFAAALAIDRRLLAMAEAAGDREAALERRFELAATHNTLGLVLERAGRLEEARNHYEADLEIRRRLSSEDPENRRWREFLATSHQYLGSLHLVRGELAAARPHLTASEAELAALVAHDPANLDWRYRWAWSRLRLGNLERASGRPGPAGSLWRESEVEARRLVAAEPDRRAWSRLLGASLVQRAGLLEGPPGEALLSEAATVLEGLAAGDEARDEAGGAGRRWLAEARLGLGDRAARRGEPEEAERWWLLAREALAPLPVEAPETETLAAEMLATETLAVETLATGAPATGVRAAAGRDHRFLLPWGEVLDRLGPPEEADQVRRRLAEIGVQVDR